MIVKKDNDEDNSPIPGNSPQSNPENKSSEVKVSIKLTSDEKSTSNSAENHSPKRDNQTLIINLKDIKQITLTSDGDLIIEFNSSASNHSIGQVITTEQISNNQELQKIRNYCQKNGKSVLSQQELNSLINTNKTDSSLTNKSKDDNNSALTIGLAIAVALIVGLVIGLVVKKRKRN